MNFRGLLTIFAMIENVQTALARHMALTNSISYDNHVSEDSKAWLLGVLVFSSD